MILWLACSGAPVDTDTAATADSDVPVDTDRPIRDVDADGSTSDADCDDYNPAVYPGASERWNSTDDDCDGIVDADGEYAGTATVDATAIYEGNPYSWRLSCPTTLHRADQSFRFAVTCTSDPEDARMVLLLGDTMEIHEVDNIVVESAFSGAVRVSSSAGWDADGSGTLTWAGFSVTTLTFTLNTRSLDVSGRAPLER
jgi:hypothetical protein